MTTIAIDATPAAVREPTGVAVYIDRLIRALAEIDHATRFLVCYRLSKIRHRALLPALASPNVRRALYDDRLPALLVPRADLFHGADIRLPAHELPKVATIHDLYSLTSPEFETPRFAAKRSAQYAAAAREARRIIAHSEHVAAQVRRAFALPAERVVSVPLGVDRRFRPLRADEAAPVLARHGIVRPYILVVGLLSRRKNPGAAVRALARLRERGGPPLSLVLAGREHDALESVRDLAARLGIADSILPLGYVPPADLPALYARARALAHLSLDEGFGLPALEAMACGTPVVASRRGALPEVAGGPAILVEPEDEDAAAQALLEAIADGREREVRVAAGLAHASHYTWEETARRTSLVYRDALSRASAAAP